MSFDPFRDADTELIAELQTELKIAKGWAECNNFALECLARRYVPFVDVPVAIELAKKEGLKMFRLKQGYSN